MADDIIFLHAPSVYDFRKKPIFYGPVSDVVPSSPVCHRIARLRDSGQG